MSAEAKGLQINIMGRELRVACAGDEQKGLLEAVDYLNDKMQEIRDRGKVLGLERLAIMAALTIAQEFLSMKVGGTFDIAETKRRIHRRWRRPSIRRWRNKASVQKRPTSRLP